MDDRPAVTPPSWLIAGVLGVIAGALFGITNALFGGFSHGWGGPALFGALMFGLIWLRIVLRRRQTRRVHHD